MSEDTDIVSSEEEIEFADELTESKKVNITEFWKILIVDDEEEVHRVTRLALRDFVFQEKGILFFSAFSASEGREIVKAQPDISLILLDVVMETDDAGLTLVVYIREELKNELVRIVLRTGQPGIAPQKEVIINYDINDYKEKSELTSQRLFTTVVSSIKGYLHMRALERFNIELERMIDERTVELRAEQVKVARAQKAMSRYIAPSIVQKILEEKITEVSNRTRCKLTIFFSDIQGFTSITDSIEPEDLANMLNEYFASMQEVVSRYKGTLANIIGDSLFVFFGAPDRTTDKDQAERCVRMAIDMQKSVSELQPKLYNLGIEYPLRIRCGITTGIVTVGSFGSQETAQYTAFGMPVNIASRLEGLCPAGEILISHPTWALVNDTIKCEEFMTTEVKGFHREIKVFKVLQ